MCDVRFESCRPNLAAMPRIVCLALALSALAACDSAGPTETPPTLPPSVDAPRLTFVPPAGEAVGEEDGHDLVFALEALFTTTGDVGPLIYSVSTGAGPISARIDGDSLRITLRSAGTDVVRITATAISAGTEEGYIQVRSTGRCPAAIPAGQTALIPDLPAGTEWAFTVTGFSLSDNYPRARWQGTARLTFGASACSDGIRTQSVTEIKTLQTAQQLPFFGTVAYGPYGDPVMSTESYVWTTSEGEVRTTAPPLLGDNAYAIPPFGQRVPRSVDSSLFASGSYNYYSGIVGDARLVAMPVTGIASFYIQTISGSNGSGDADWRRTLP